MGKVVSICGEVFIMSKFKAERCLKLSMKKWFLSDNLVIIFDSSK